jgi:membrane-bound lytic murein transglycosylase B
MPEAAETTTAAAMVSEARRLVEHGWCQGAHARGDDRVEVPSWSEEASSWSLLGALLASWHRQDSQEDQDVVAHLIDAHALGQATEVLGGVVGTASLEQWNDSPGRSQADVIGAFERALDRLEETD